MKQTNICRLSGDINDIVKDHTYTNYKRIWGRDELGRALKQKLQLHFTNNRCLQSQGNVNHRLGTSNYTVSQKKERCYILDNNWNINCPITIVLVHLLFSLTLTVVT